MLITMKTYKSYVSNYENIKSSKLFYDKEN